MQVDGTMEEKAESRESLGSKIASIASQEWIQVPAWAWGLIALILTGACGLIAHRSINSVSRAEAEKMLSAQMKLIEQKLDAIEKTKVTAKDVQSLITNHAPWLRDKGTIEQKLTHIEGTQTQFLNDFKSLFKELKEAIEKNTEAYNKLNVTVIKLESKIKS